MLAHKCWQNIVGPLFLKNKKTISRQIHSSSPIGIQKGKTADRGDVTSKAYSHGVSLHLILLAQNFKQCHFEPFMYKFRGDNTHRNVFPPQHYPIPIVLQSPYLLNSFRPDLIKMLLSHLVPDKVR